jgi:pantetheine-phosphate adenylyltransferase
MRLGVYAGSFSPFTLGHLDIARRAAKLFDRLYIAVMINGAKTPLWSARERCAMIEASLADSGLDNIVVESDGGLLADYAKKRGACALIRGIRDAADLAAETQAFAANRLLNPGLESVFLLSRPELAFISSALVREIAGFQGDLRGLVPEAIRNNIMERWKRQ